MAGYVTIACYAAMLLMLLRYARYTQLDLITAAAGL